MRFLRGEAQESATLIRVLKIVLGMQITEKIEYSQRENLLHCVKEGGKSRFYPIIMGK